MKTIISSRASTILFNWIKSNKISNDVLVPANICETVPAVYLKCGLKINCLDITREDWNVSKKEILDLVKHKNYIVHYNHTYGKNEESLSEFFSEIKRINNDTIIVDDRCLCIPDTNVFSSDADLILYSTGPKKIVDLGYGGFAYCHDNYVYNKCIIDYNKSSLDNFENFVAKSHIQNHGLDISIITSDWIEEFDDRYDAKEYFELIEKKLCAVIQLKNRINKIYDELSNYCIGLNDWRYNILVGNKEECMQKIFANNLYCSSHYMSLANGYFFNKKTPNADYLYKNVINLFNDFYFDEIKAKEIVKVLKTVMLPVKR